jgi:hypothetical protein
MIPLLLTTAQIAPSQDICPIDSLSSAQVGGPIFVDPIKKQPGGWGYSSVV